MTTTPDSRIAHDWNPDGTPYDTADRHLGPMTHKHAAEPNFIFAREDFMQKLASATSDQIDTSTTATPDTSTTAGKIAVMQAYERGEPCEWRPRPLVGPYIDWQPVVQQPQWNWCNTDYRIAPPPAPRTALQAARECRSRMTTVDVTSPAGRLCSLLTDIDCAPVVEVLERRISWGASDLSALPKGRYRLVRDDA